MNIKNWFETRKINLILAGIILVLLLMQVRSCDNAKIAAKKLEVAEHNLAAANDSIRVTKDKQDKDEYNKLAFLTDKISKLEALSADLYKEVKSIKGKPATIIKGDIQIVEKEVPIVVEGKIIDNIVRADFSFDRQYSEGNFRKLTGYTKYDLRTGSAEGILTLDQTGIRVTTGIKNLDKGKPEIFFKSDHPGFSVTALEGAVLDPKLFKSSRVRLITIGAHVGWTPVTYDFGTQRVDVNLRRIGASAGLNINLTKLFKR